MYVGISWDNGINPATGVQKTSFRVGPGLVSLPDRNNDVNNIYVRKFSRKEINKHRSININFTYFPLSSEIHSKTDPCAYILLRNGNSYQQNLSDYNSCKLQNPTITNYFFPENGDYLYYTIYEYDTGFWDLNGYKQVDIQGNNFTQKIYYRSNESPYCTGRLKILPKNQPNQTYHNTGWANINSNSISVNFRNR